MHAIKSLLLLSVIALSACSFSDDNTPPTVSSTVPADGAVDVDPLTDISASFNEDIFANSLDANSLTVSVNGNNRSGTLGFDAITRTLTFVSDQMLPLATTITATLSGNITDLAGNAISQTSWSFITRDGQWDLADLRDAEDGIAQVPRVAFAPDGTAIAVWQQHDGIAISIYAAHYVPGLGWGYPGVIELEPANDATGPSIAIDGAGNAIVVWAQSDGTVTSIWSNRFTPDAGWGTPEILEIDNAGNAAGATVAVDATGNAIAIWAQLNGGGIASVYYNLFTPANGWQSVATQLDMVATNAFLPDISMNANGTAIAVWTQDAGGAFYNVVSRRYTPTGGWEPVLPIENDNLHSAISAFVGVDAAGNALTTWIQNDGTSVKPQANRFDATTGQWGTATPLETGNLNSDNARIAVNQAGEAIVAWMRFSGTRYDIRGTRYTPGGGWGSAGDVETDDTGDALFPRVAIDQSGNAIVVWQQYKELLTMNPSAFADIYALRFVSATESQSNMLLETDDAGSATNPFIAIGPGAEGMAIWQQSDGSFTNIYTNIFQ